MTRLTAILAAAAVALGLVAGVYLAFFRPVGGDVFADCRDGAVAGGTATIGGPFTLTAGGGARVGFEDVVRRPTLLYFGYAFCPDVCPFDLARNAEAVDLLATRGVEAGLVFVTIDPERDTPELAAEYAASFHPGAVGLSGSAEDVAAAAGAYRVYFDRMDDDPQYYLMQHTTYTYLVAPDNPFLEFFPSQASAAEVAEAVACYAGRL